VERALLRPNGELSWPFCIELLSRNPARVAALQRRYKLEWRKRGFDEILADRNIDAVYIALPNVMHGTAVMAALRANKAVLVEKPMAVQRSEVTQIADHVAESGGILIEGVMTQYHPWIAELGGWGTARPRASALTKIAFPLEPRRLERMLPSRSGGGTWYDVAPYWAHFLEQAGFGLPETVIVVDEKWSHAAFDLAVVLEALCGGRSAKLVASFQEPFRASHTLIDGCECIEIPNFLRPTAGNSSLQTREWRGQQVKSDRWIKGPGYYLAQLAYFLDCIRRRETVFEKPSWERAFFVAAIGEALSRGHEAGGSRPPYRLLF
jgi:NDP-hexose-3-ketoreductase